MKRVGVLLLAVVAIASSALGETFLSVSDVHFDPFADPAIIGKLEAADAAQWDEIFASSTVTAFSTFGSDVNEPLLTSAIAEMQKQLPSPAFIAISGDFLAHDFNKTYQQYATDKSQAAYSAFVDKTMRYVASRLSKAFPGVRIYPTLGNNDSDCGDYAVAPDGAFLAHFRDTWSAIVGARSFDRRFPTGGYYRLDIPALRGVRLIALNTNFFSTKYQNPCGKPGPDPGARELEWLDDELRLARVEGKRVWLLFHIPPGMDVYDTVAYGGACPSLKTQTFWKEQYLQEYLRIAAAHRKTIVGSFAGHTHQDEFRFAGGDFIHINPSISPVFGNNPAFEIVTVDRTGNISDYTAWHLPNVTLPWVREYSFRDAYGKPRYDAAALTGLAASIGNDAATREKYFTYYSSSNAKSTAEALQQWKGYWCGLSAMAGPAFDQCYCP
jgi:sphingomyelin phosphodiesterase acid-like 3